jgi:pimeloyl-ACP methyl ester carboxylesterase
VHDVPAILDAVCASTGHDQVDWVGHSMGGMLLYTTLVQWPDRVAAGVTIGSPATFPAPEWQHKALAHLGWALGGRGRFAGARMGKLASALFGVHTPGFGLVADLDNVAPLEANGLARVALTDLPRPMAKQAAAWMKAGTITRVDGSPWVSPAPEGSGAGVAPEVPLLAIGARYDHVVPAANVEATCALFGACSYVEVPYGHVDAVLGTTAQDVVYPVVGAFLSQ